MKRTFLYILAALLAASCKNSSVQNNKSEGDKPVITVTIEPLRYFTEAIAGDNFNVISMVPKGSSPETYDPTPQQLVDLAKSKAYFRIGYIGFEQTWMDKLTDNAPHLQKIFYQAQEQAYSVLSMEEQAVLYKLQERILAQILQNDRKPANKKSSPKMSLTEEKIAGGR